MGLGLKWQVVIVRVCICTCCYCFLWFGFAHLSVCSGQGKQLNGIAGAIKPCFDTIAFALVALRFHPS